MPHISTLTLHDVARVSLEEPKDLTGTGQHVRSLIVRTETGDRFAITLFASDPRLLDVVKEG